MSQRLHTIYFAELYRLAHDVVAAIGRASKVLEGRQNQDFLITAPEPMDSLIAAVGAAANLSKLLDDNRPRRMSDDAWDVRRQRVASLRSALAGLELPTILSRDLRNSIEHFDERLDELVAEERNTSGRSLIYNMTVSRLAVLPPLGVPGELFPLRVFEASTGILSNFGEQIDTQELAEEAASIMAALDRAGFKEKLGGMIVPGAPS